MLSVHARKAVELDPGDADALAGLAWNQQFYGEMDNVLGLSRQALAMNPNCARAYVVLGVCLIMTGRTAEGREAIAVFERLTPRDPSITIARGQIIVSHYFDRDYERCVEAARRLLSAEPDTPLYYRWMAAALGQLGRAEEARARPRQGNQRFSAGIRRLCPQPRALDAPRGPRTHARRPAQIRLA